MKVKILEALKTKYSNLGLSDEILEGVANQLTLFVKEEPEIATAVAGVEPQLKAVQKFADLRVTKFKTENDILKEQVRKKGDEQAEKTEAEVSETEMPGWAKALQESIRGLSTDLGAIKGEKVHTSLSEKLLSALKEKNVPEDYYAPALLGREFKTEDDVNALSSGIIAGYEKYQQAIANGREGVVSQNASGGKGENAEAKAVADIINKGTKEITELKK